jgi:hypothetical protein
VKLNLGCWIFYQEGYVNIDRNRKVRADRYEDISTLPSFEANCVDQIYAGHVAEHVDDVKASFGRWFEVLKPGGRITITVAGLSRCKSFVVRTKTFPRLGVRTRLKESLPSNASCQASAEKGRDYRFVVIDRGNFNEPHRFHAYSQGRFIKDPIVQEPFPFF